jgi:hypothetical protein
MSASSETRRLLKQQEKTLRDAYYNRNGLSMSDEQREKYRAQQTRAAEARRAMAARLAALQRGIG